MTCFVFAIVCWVLAAMCGYSYCLTALDAPDDTRYDDLPRILQLQLGNHLKSAVIFILMGFILYLN